MVEYMLYFVVMKRFSEMMESLWRTECQYLDVREALPVIREVLARRFTVKWISVHRYEPVQMLLSTRAVDPPDAATIIHVNLASSEARSLQEWLAAGGITIVGGRAIPPAAISLLFGSLTDGTNVLVPLRQGQSAGVLVVCIGPDLDEDTGKLVGELLREPMSTALENDRRLRELESARDTAEADRQELLEHLGRDKVHPSIVGADTGLRCVMDRVALSAGTDVPVLLIGETGSGKEVIARSIHEGSSRRAGPFIRVNCGAIPPDLADSELFGHERGAFTGATSTRRGWFERADGGTLFMDEIGELPLPVQVRLLRVLQDGTFQRVGGEESLQSDTRLVAATNRDLAAMVRAGSFREDLWYRIAVFPLLLPPLRERRADIPTLANELARRASRRYGLRLQMPTAMDHVLLCEYDWPGNVRELGSVIDRAAILGKGERLEIAAALGLEYGDDARAVGPDELEHAARPTNGAVGRNGAYPLQALDDVVRNHITKSLALTGGRIDGPHGCARILGVHPNTLRARMRKLGIDWRQSRI
jgi:transcriptional regulator with GAF, ATPase, and Fis domain